MEFSDQELLRYSRHILLPEIGVEGQTKLTQAKVLIIGVGGLGSPVALYLAASGVGEITIADHDVVELNNLQRQIAHTEARIGDYKTDSCAANMLRLNSTIKINPLPIKLTGQELDKQVAAADLVLDCTDNLTTRFDINKACVNHKTPLISAAAIRWEGQISVYDSSQEESPCYYCCYGNGFYGGSSNIEQSCSENGVVSPVVGILGSMQALQAIKLIVKTGDNLVGRVLLFDALSMQWESMQLPKNPACLVCGK